MLDTLGNLIDLTYAAVEDPKQWKVFLGAFCRAINGDHAMFSIFYQDRGSWDVSCLFGITAEEIAEYGRLWWQEDPWCPGGKLPTWAQIGEIVPSERLCPDEKLEQLPVYKEYLSQRNWHYGGGVLLAESRHQSALMTTSRAKSKGPLAAEELSLWRKLVPHLQRSVRLSGEFAGLQTERSVLVAYVDQLPAPLFLVNQRGSLLHANDAGDRLLKDSSTVSRNGQHLKWHSPSAQEKFQAALGTIGRPNEYVKEHEAQFTVERTDGQTPLLVLVNSVGPAQPRVGVDQPTASVYVIDPSVSRSVDEAHLRSLYGLTPAEASVASLIARGFTTGEAANQSGVTMNTLRTHLKRALEKTGCRRQAELVALVLRA
jgi:DNA-binding CsgD family transcriptional regulator